MVSGISPSAALRNPAAPGCLSPIGIAAVNGALGAAAPLIIGNLNRLSTLNDLGTIRDVYNQRSENFAVFTHNIFKITDRLSITAGLRYTHEKKDFNASFQNNNTVCPALQAGTAQGGLGGLLANPALASTAAGIITLGCTGNSTIGLNGKTISDNLSEGELTGTGVISYKPVDGLMVYASYSRGYKAGGYNLDRSDLGPAYLASTTANPNAALLRFDPETVNSYEVGFKYSSRRFTLNVAGFRQEFSNFQLNTFNGTNYIVQNIGSCKTSLNDADGDNSAATGACTAGVKYGVLSQGIEIEAGLLPGTELRGEPGLHAGRHQVPEQPGRQQGGRGARSVPGAAAGPADVERAAQRGDHVDQLDAGYRDDAACPPCSMSMAASSSDYNTGSDLFVEKEQDGYFLMNARIGIRGPDQNWSLEVWAQNLLNTQYQQVAFNAPFQGAGSQSQVQKFGAPAFATGNQIFSAFLAEPRTYGVTLRKRF